MKRYRVYLEAIASVSIEVEAHDEDDAIDKAHELTPSGGWDWPDMGDWYFPPDERGALVRADFVQVIS